MRRFALSSPAPWGHQPFMGFLMKEYPMPSGGFPVPWSDDNEVEPNRIPAASLGQVQKQSPPPGVCCQLDPMGNTVCSDGKVYPPGCPWAPAINTSGVAQQTIVNGALMPIAPSAEACKPKPEDEPEDEPKDLNGLKPVNMVALAAGALGLAALGYFLGS